MTKQCTLCKNTLPLANFANQATGKKGKRSSCKECVKNTYQRTKKGLVLAMHANQRAKSKKRGHPQPAYSREELFTWCDQQPQFHAMYDDWVASNYDMQTKPTCDRLDDYKPYSLCNLQLLTYKDNSTKYYQDAISGINTKSASAVVCYNLDGSYHCEYHSLSAAARAVGTSHANIRNVCEGKPISRTNPDGSIRTSIPKTCKGFKWEYK